MNNYIEKYLYIKDLLNKYLNHTDGCIKMIKAILKQSCFNLGLNQDKNTSKNIYCLNGHYEIDLQDFNTSQSVIRDKNNSNEDNIVENADDENESFLHYTFIFMEKLEYIYQRIKHKFGDWAKISDQIIIHPNLRMR